LELLVLNRDGWFHRPSTNDNRFGRLGQGECCLRCAFFRNWRGEFFNQRMLASGVTTTFRVPQRI